MRELETEKDAMKRMKELADQQFVHHKLIKETDHSWYCSTPGTMIFSFRVADLPGLIVTWGDLGSLCIDSGVRYDMSWAEGAVKSRRYFLEKASADRYGHYYPGNFKEHLRYRIDEEDASDSTYDQAAKSGFSEEAFKDYMYEKGDSELGDIAYGYKPQVHLQCEAFAFFFKLKNVS